jgi:Sodium/hydrogen exchanger family
VGSSIWRPLVTRLSGETTIGLSAPTRRGGEYDPAEAPAAARYLDEAGAPEDYRAALYAHKHAGWYVADRVLDVFAAVFFASIGMLIDLGFVADHLGDVAFFALAVIVVKAVAVAVAARAFRQTAAQHCCWP